MTHANTPDEVFKYLQAKPAEFWFMGVKYRREDIIKPNEIDHSVSTSSGQIVININLQKEKSV